MQTTETPVDTVPADTDAPADTDVADTDADVEDTDVEADPEPPAGLEHYLTGDPADADVVPTGPGLLLMGGGPDVDAAFRWQRDQIAGGDVVVLRTSGSDGYNDYLFTDIGQVDSVETLLVTSRALADDPYVGWRVATAEAVFLAGGDQATYLDAWKDTAVSAGLQTVWERGGVLGGTSAGCAVLGSLVYAAYEGSVRPDEALEDPFNRFMTFDTFLDLPPLRGVITDTHFYERDRFGRLVGFTARLAVDAGSGVGIGVDEGTALMVDAGGRGRVVGDGYVYVVRGGAPEVCLPGEPLVYDLDSHPLVAGDEVLLPAGTNPVPAEPVSASDGLLTPASPY
jgi:cyanophycinase